MLYTFERLRDPTPLELDLPGLIELESQAAQLVKPNLDLKKWNEREKLESVLRDSRFRGTILHEVTVTPLEDPFVTFNNIISGDNAEFEFRHPKPNANTLRADQGARTEFHKNTGLGWYIDYVLSGLTGEYPLRAVEFIFDLSLIQRKEVSLCSKKQPDLAMLVAEESGVKWYSAPFDNSHSKTVRRFIGINCEDASNLEKGIIPISPTAQGTNYTKPGMISYDGNN